MRVSHLELMVPSTARAPGGMSGCGKRLQRARPAATRDGSSDADEKAGPDDGNQHLTDDPAHGRAEDRHQDEVADNGANYAKYDVDQQPVRGMHDLTGHPASKSANDDGKNPAKSNHDRAPSLSC